MQNTEAIYIKEYYEGKMPGGYWGYNEERLLGHFRILASCLNKAVRPQRMLDIGCAKGYLVLSFKELNIDSYGVDISAYAISKAPVEIRDKLSVISVEKNRLPFPDNYFDLVSMIDVIEHFKNVDLCIKEIQRVLKIGGMFFMVTPEAERKTTEGMHPNIHPPDFWIKLFQQKGLLFDLKALELVERQIRESKRKFLKEMEHRIIGSNSTQSSKLLAFFINLSKTNKLLLNLGAHMWYHGLLKSYAEQRRVKNRAISLFILFFLAIDSYFVFKKNQ